MHRIDLTKMERPRVVLVDFCHTKLRLQENKYSGHLLGKSKTTHVAKKSNFIIFWSE